MLCGVAEFECLAQQARETRKRRWKVKEDHLKESSGGNAAGCFAETASPGSGSIKAATSDSHSGDAKVLNLTGQDINTSREGRTQGRKTTSTPGTSDKATHC